MSPGLGDYNVAAQMRDVVRRMVREELSTYRPPDRFGRAVSKDIAANKCSVVLAGDTEAIKVNMSQGCIPDKTDAEDGANLGSIVRVSGVPGNYWISQVCSGSEFSSSPVLFRMIKNGGDSGTRQIEFNDSVDGGLPALGNAWHMGRWENTASTTAPAMSIVEAIVVQTTLVTTMKRYVFPLRDTDSTNSAWNSCAADIDSGPDLNKDFDLEVLSDATGFELRVRRTTYDPGGLPNSGYFLYLRIIGEEWKRASNGTGETADARPQVFVNSRPIFAINGPFLSPAMHMPELAQVALSGGYDLRLVGANVVWNIPYRVSGVGINHMIPAGFFDITRPTTGNITIFGNETGGSVGVGTSGVPLADGQALYYEPPWGSTTTASSVSNFRIVTRGATTRYFQVPSHWVLLCTRENGVLMNANPQTVPGMTVGIPKIVSKTATDSLASNITPTNDADLFFTMQPGVRYRVAINLSVSGDPGFFRSNWSGPADMGGNKFILGPPVHTSTGFVARDDTNARASAHGFGTAVTYKVGAINFNSAILEQGIIVSTTGGTFRFQWAQAVSSTTATNVSGASWMEYVVIE